MVSVTSVIVLVVLGLGYLALAHRHAQHRELVVGLFPLTDHEAIVLLRDPSVPPRGWILRARSDGQVVWKTELPSAVTGVRDRHGITTNGDVLIVLAGDMAEPDTIVALDAHNGSVRWQHEPSQRSVLAPRIQGGELIITSKLESGESTFVRTFALADGQPRFMHSQREEISLDRPTESARYFLGRSYGWEVLSLDAAGEQSAKRFNTYGDVCAVGDVLFGLEGTDLLRGDMNDEARIFEHIPLSPTSSEARSGFAETCGQRGEELVFLVQETYELSLLFVNRKGGVRKRLSLGEAQIAMSGYTRDELDPAFHPLRGSVDAFVPILLRRGEMRELVMIDMVRGEIAWKSAPRSDLLGYQIFRGRVVHYLASGRRIVAFDAANGHVLSAVDTTLSIPHGFYVTRHVLWGISYDRSPTSALSVCALDARTLTRRAGPNAAQPPVRDGLARAVEWLSVPREFQ